MTNVIDQNGNVPYAFLNFAQAPRTLRLPSRAAPTAIFSRQSGARAQVSTAT